LFASDDNFQEKLTIKPHRSYGPNKNNMFFFPTTIGKLMALGLAIPSAKAGVP